MAINTELRRTADGLAYSVTYNTVSGQTEIKRVKEIPPTVKQIIYQPELKTTVVIWHDDSRTIVKCADGEDFVPEVGFAMALVKKTFPNRSDFLRMIEKAYYQPVKPKTKMEKK